MRKISLAIVTYNNSKIIKDTVESIVNNIPQDYDYILYIIDNNSTDDTVKIVNELAGNIELIQLKENRGFGYGHNHILNKIQSDYHFVVNPDIIIEDEFQIKKMIEYLDENDQVGLLTPKIVNSDSTIQYLCKTNPTIFDMMIRWISPSIFSNRQDRYVMKQTGYDNLMEIEYASGCFMVFRTNVYKGIKGFDENFFMYLEDADITRRTNQVSKTIFYPDARVIHLWSRDSHKKVKYTLIMIQSMYIYFKKWGIKVI